MKSPVKFYFLLVLLLLLQTFLRTHHLDIQNPYIDEGFHIRRAGFVWDFEFHPARVSHGKLLVYFWLGLFETDRLHVLVPSRMAIALVSLVTGAALYAIGKKLHSHSAGLLALTLYIFCPIALFYERMAMADPLASMLATLVVWRSPILIQKPTLREGALIGGLIGLSAMAKLTMGLTPLIPTLATILFIRIPKDTLHTHPASTLIRHWFKVYFPPLLIAAMTTVLLWLPILIPAAIASRTDEPFKLVNAYNIRSNAEEEEERYSPLEYLEEIRVEMDDFFTENLILFIGALFGLAFFLQPKQIRAFLFIALWFAVIVLPSLVGARLATARYFMPMSAPLMFALAYAVVSLWGKNPAKAVSFNNFIGLVFPLTSRSPLPPVKRGRKSFSLAIRGTYFTWAKRILSLSAAAVVGYWLAIHAIPFARTDLTNPDALDFNETNYTEYQSGFLIANEAERIAARTLNENKLTPVTANWNLCHYLYFYTEKEVACLGLDTIRDDLRHFVEALPEGESGYLILSGYRPFFQSMAGIGWEEVVRYKQERIRTESWDVQIWQVWQQ